MSRTTQEALEQDVVELSNVKGDAESYHVEFDDLLEKRLAELDPDYMNAMTKEYEASGRGRWYA